MYGGGGDPDGNGGGGGEPLAADIPEIAQRFDRDRVKEAEKITLQPAPKTAAGFAKCSNGVIDDVVAASGRSGACYAWFTQVEDPTISCQDLGIPGEHKGKSWEPFDDKLRSAAMKCTEKGANPELEKSLLRRSEEFRKEFKTLIRGMQLMRLIYQWYQANGEMKQVYGLKELSTVEFRNDDLEGFLNEWLRVLNGQRDPREIIPLTEATATLASS